MNVELIVAGVSKPGPKNTNVAFTVDGNGVRREAWILNETVETYKIDAGFKLIVEQAIFGDWSKFKSGGHLALCIHRR